MFHCAELYYIWNTIQRTSMKVSRLLLARKRGGAWRSHPQELLGVNLVCLEGVLYFI